MAKLTLSFRNRPLKVFALPEGETMVGSDPGCHIVIDSLAVAPRHVLIRWDGETATVEARDPQYTLALNENPIEQETLHHGDTLQVGKHSLIFSTETTRHADTPSEEPASSVSETTVGWLQVLSGNHLGRILRLDQGLTRIGKRNQHVAVIARRDDGYYISHLEGTTPTRVNDQDIGEETYRLNEADTIEVAEVRMQFFQDPADQREQGT